MKSLLIFLMLFISFNSYSQIDKNGNPVVHSVTINEIQLDGFKLSVNYYSLMNNIDNSNSAVFISNSPSQKEIAKAAIEMPSYFYILIKNQQVVNIITLNTYPSNTLLVVNPKTKEYKKFKTNLKGEITEDRAKEIINQQIDLSAKIDNGSLYFNDDKFEIIERKAIEKAIIELIKEEKLINLKGGNELSDFYKKILSESKPGGRIDVFTEIKGDEEKMVIFYNHLATLENVALYKWGRLVLAAGVESIDDVLLIYSKFKDRDLNDREIEYITKGFNKEWEK